MADMQVLVTRPEPQATEWVHLLRTHGVQAEALPLLAIEGPSDVAAVQHLWHNLPQQALLMFVSPAAVEWFFRLRPLTRHWPAHTLAAAPGPGTAKALLQAGAPHGLTSAHLRAPSPESAQFDSESLWPVLAHENWADRRVTIVSGGDQFEARGRKWLTEQLQTHGATVQALLCYQRGPSTWHTPQQQLATRAVNEPAHHVWLFSSSQSIDQLADKHLPALQLSCPPIWAQAHALTTHPRITERAQQMGFGHILETRPTLSAVVAALRPLIGA